MKRFYFIVNLWLVLLVSGCSIDFNPDMLPTVPADLIPSELPIATPSPAPGPDLPMHPAAPFQPIMSPTPVYSPTPFSPFSVKAAEDHVNVRYNPGLLFDVMITVNQGAPFMLIGKAPGGEWMLVETASQKRGWVAAQWLKSDIDLQQAPLVEPEKVVLIKGQVLDINKEPVSGVKFNILQAAGGKKMHNEAQTDKDGTFYAYMPPGVKGVWTVAFISLACTSNKMDANCKCTKGVCGMVLPFSTNLTLPQKNILQFSWN